ncbi:MAG TPA: GlsB/YeaQ/YmgE family stress response membrane protein [Candidatus Saccharimonadales bacterium]|nr:GlsB/YeaQ/YmgE family stress response membrane protein [Candidatus Saccharimonadales bacterium]
MSIIVWIILGGIVGWLAAKLLGRHEGAIASIIIGIIGSLIGGWISRLFTGSDQSFLAFSWTGLFWSFIGAIVLVAVLNAFSGRRHHTPTY